MTEAAAAATHIAIVGMSCRVPGARTVDQFWANLCAGAESIRRLTNDEMLEAGLDPEALGDPQHVPFGALIDNVDRFDAAFFGIPTREAELMDPQHRLFLEGAWEALEHAGYDPSRVPGAVGVFGGANFNSYLARNLLPAAVFDDPSAALPVILSNEKDYLATRVSYKLNLRGPAFTVQSGCSTSLVAVHLAMQSLLNYECDLALAGGVAIDLARAEGYWAHEGSVNSPDGHCRTFDANARGTVFGNGIGMVVLKRLQDAIDDGDQVYAVILGSAVNNDGSVKVGFTAPSVAGQVSVISEALADAGVPAHSIGYVEAHGTGTPLGDPVEVEALTRAFGPRAAVYDTCALGAVKTNVGHLDSAAGVISLIKTALALRSGLLPASLHFVAPNPAIDFSGSPFAVNTRLTPWTRGTAPGLPRRAGVSSFGMGGTNVHVVLEEPPLSPSPTASGRSEVLIWSARTEKALDEMTENLRAAFEADPDVELGDVAFTLQTGRTRFAHRRTLACRDLADAIAALATPSSGRIRTVETRDGDRPIAFMFPGQGAQHVDMARGLFESEPVFREAMTACCADLESEAGIDLRAILYPVEREFANWRLHETEWTQPALFAIEYSLAQLWASWDVRPAACIGHSLGEYAAACIAGVFSRRDALRVLAARGRLMQQLPEGAMTAVALPADCLPLEPGLSIAALNGAAHTVVSGPPDAIDALERRLENEHVTFRRLHTSRAFHSPVVDGIMSRFVEAFKSVTLSRPVVPFVSNVTGRWIEAEEAINPHYWAEQLRRTVRFGEGLTCLDDAGPFHLLEVGPGRTLTSLAGQQRTDSADLIVNSLPAPSEGSGDRLAMIDAAGRLWQRGVDINWRAMHAERRPRHVALPTYPFQRERLWIEPPAKEDENTPPQKRADPAEWLYVQRWRQTAPVTLLGRARVDPAAHNWLIFADDTPLSVEIANHLLAAAPECTVVVRPGARNERVSQTEFSLDSSAADAYRWLFEDLVAAGWTSATIVHLWALTNGGFDRCDAPSIRRAQDFGFYSLLRIVQAADAAGLNGALSLRIVTRHAQDVSGTEPLAVASSTVFSAARVLPQELPTVDAASIDVDAVTSRTARLVLSELLHAVPEPTVAIRDGSRLVPTYERIVSPAPAFPVARRNGTYVILGGLGKVGLALAEHLAKTARARLVLIGKTGLPPRETWSNVSDQPTSERISKVRAIESSGSEVMILRADIGDADALRRAFEEAERRFGSIHGVVVAAGIVDRQAFQMARAISPEECDRQFRPKLDGLFALEQALAARRPDFCVVVSSLSSILGGLGYSAYAAANMLVDAFVRFHNHSGGRRWLTMNWDAWRWGELPQGMSKYSVAALALTAGEGGTVFDLALQASESDQIIISTSDFGRRVRDWVDAIGARGAARTEAAPAAVPVDAADAAPSATPTPVAPQLSATQQAVVDVWQQVLGIRHVAFSESFLDIGGTSLTAVQAISSLQQVLGVRVAIEEFIFQTAAQLAALCDKKKETAAASASVSAKPGRLMRSLGGAIVGR